MPNPISAVGGVFIGRVVDPANIVALAPSKEFSFGGLKEGPHDVGWLPTFTGLAIVDEAGLTVEATPQVGFGNIV
jgi:hypothetical protein